MAIEKGFIQNKNQLFEVPRRKLILGGIVFVVLAILLFNFLNFLELFLILFDAIRNDFEPYFLKGRTKFYYHLILGAISMYFAFSVMYRYWLDAPKKLGQRKIYQRKLAISNVRVYNWYFLHWFFELGFLLTLFLALVKGVNFYPEYAYLVWLVIAVFFGQIWMAIRPIVKKKFIWFLGSLCIFLAGSYLIPQVNFTNPEKIQTKLLGNNLLYQNNIRLVTSDVFFPMNHNRSRGFDILIPSTSKDSLFYEGEKIHTSDLAAKIFRSRDEFYDWELPHYRHRLYVDKDVEMSRVFELKKRFSKMDVNTVSFMFKAPEDDRPFYYKSDVGLGFYLPSNVDYTWEIDDPEIMNMEILNVTQLIFDQDTLSHRQFRVRLKEKFKVTKTKSVQIFMTPETKYETYFKTIESIFYVVMELRNQLALKDYASPYQELTPEQREIMREVHRFHVIDHIQE